MIALLGIAAILLVGGGVAAAVVATVGAKAVGRNAKQDLELIPGVDLGVPDGWFGSHDLEAKLFRRVRDSLRGIQAASADNVDFYPTKAAAESQAASLVRQLIACSHLPAGAKAQPLKQVELDVAEYESLAAQVVTKAAGIGGPQLSGELQELSRQLEVMAEARAEVDEIDNPGGATG